MVAFNLLQFRETSKETALEATSRQHEESARHSPESALLVGLSLPDTPRGETEDSLDELSRLVTTATIKVAGRITQARPRVEPRYYIGKGKAEELKSRAAAAGAGMIVFDCDLTPAQMRNLENLTDLRILDRSAIILDIFSRHARTRTSQVQVEVAQLNYLMPRLTRQWSHLSRQAGGGAIRGMGAAGVRGPGETQLETDRRMIRRRIGALTRELDRIGNQLETSRRGRREEFRVALVGYTNAGKSTLMRALSGAEVLVEDQLFATLDSTTRSVELEGNRKILLTDTVGFIRRLPHHLVASFRATLEEAAQADLLLHVLDASHPHWGAHAATVAEVLSTLGAADKPVIEVHNKLDRMEEEGGLYVRSLLSQAGKVAVSALSGEGLDLLKEKIRFYCEEREVTLDLRIPQREGRLLSQLFAQGEVLERSYDSKEVRVRVRLDAVRAERWQLDRFAAS